MKNQHELEDELEDGEEDRGEFAWVFGFLEFLGALLLGPFFSLKGKAGELIKGSGRRGGTIVTIGLVIVAEVNFILAILTFDFQDWLLVLGPGRRLLAIAGITLVFFVIEYLIYTVVWMIRYIDESHRNNQIRYHSDLDREWPVWKIILAVVFGRPLRGLWRLFVRNQVAGMILLMAVVAVTLANVTKPMMPWYLLPLIYYALWAGYFYATRIADNWRTSRHVDC